MNRLVGNVWIIDSAGLWLTSNSADNGDFHNMVIQNVFIATTETESLLQLTVQSNTAQNIIVDEISNWTNPAARGSSYGKEYDNFRVSERVYVRLCQNGTGYLILR